MGLSGDFRAILRVFCSLQFSYTIKRFFSVNAIYLVVVYGSKVVVDLFRSDIRFYLSGPELISLFVGIIPFRRNVLADSLFSLLSEGSLVC